MTKQVPRDRTRSTPGCTGTFYRKVSGKVINNSTATAWTNSRCQDIAGYSDGFGNAVDHPLTITRVDRDKVEGISGGFKNSVSDIRYKNWPAIYARNLTPAHLVIPEMPDIGSDVIKVLALTNPSRNGPGSWGETLGDIGQLPDLLKRRGGSFLRRGADGKLIWDWAILPVIRDIELLKQLQRDIERRLRELDSLNKKGGLHRKIDLGRYSASSGPSSLTTFESNYFLIQGVVTTNTKVHRWATVRWHWPKGYSPPPIPPSALRKWAAKRVLGINGDLALYWELIPWSFLFDWWRDVGRWLAAQNRDIPAEPSPVCIMQHTVTTASLVVTNRPAGVSGGGGQVIHETKTRDIVAGLPAVLSSQGPALGAGQLTNLGALLIKYTAK